MFSYYNMSSSPYGEFFAESPEGEGYELSQGSSKSASLSPQKISKSQSLSPESSIQKGLENFKERVKEVRKSIQRAESRSISPKVGAIKTTVVVYRNGKVLENPSSYEEGDLVEIPTGLRFVRTKLETVVPTKLTAKSEWIVDQTKKFEELKKEGSHPKKSELKKMKKQLDEMWKRLPKEEKDKYKKKATETKNRIRTKSKMAFIMRNVLTTGGKRLQEKVQLGKLDITELRAMIPDDVEGVKQMKRADLVKYIKNNSEHEDIEIDYDLEKLDDRAQAIVLAMKGGKTKLKAPSRVLQASVEVVSGEEGQPRKAKKIANVGSLNVGQKEGIVEVIVAKKPTENVGVAYTGVYRFFVHKPKVISLQDPEGKTVQTTVYREIPFRSKVIFDEVKSLKNMSKEELIEVLRKYSTVKKSGLKNKTVLELKFLLAGAKRGIKLIQDSTLGPVIKEQLKLAKDVKDVRAIIENFDLPVDKSDTEEKMRKALRKLARKLTKNIDKNKLLRNGVPVPGVIPLIPGEEYEIEYIPEPKLLSGERPLSAERKPLVPTTGKLRRRKIVKEQKKGFVDIVRVVVSQGDVNKLEAGDKLSIRHKNNAFNGAVIHKVGTHIILSGIFIENAEVFAQLPAEEKRKAPIVILDMNLLKDSLSIDGSYFGHFLGDIREKTGETITAISTFLPYRREHDYEPHLERKEKVKVATYGEIQIDKKGKMKAPKYYKGITRIISPKELRIAEGIKLQVRSLDEIMSSELDKVLMNAVDLSLKNTVYGLFGKLKKVQLGEGEVLTAIPTPELDEMLAILYRNLGEENRTVGKFMKHVAPLMIFLSHNLIGDNAKIFKAKVKSGMYSIANLDKAKMYHFLPELYMNNKLSGVELLEAESIIDSYIKNVSETFVESVYGLRAKQRGGIPNIKKYLINPDKICKTIDGKPVEDGRLIICEQDGEFYCLSVDQVMQLVNEQNLGRVGQLPVNPLTGKTFSKEFINNIMERYEVEMELMKQINVPEKVSLKKTPSPQKGKKAKRGKMIIGKVGEITPRTPPKKLSDRKKQRLYKKFVERWGYEYGTYNDADIAAIKEGTGLTRKEQKEIKESKGYFKYAPLPSLKGREAALAELTPRTRQALVKEQKQLEKAGLRAPPIAELREMAKEYAETQKKQKRPQKRPVKRVLSTSSPKPKRWSKSKIDNASTEELLARRKVLNKWIKKNRKYKDVAGKKGEDYLKVYDEFEYVNEIIST